MAAKRKITKRARRMDSSNGSVRSKTSAKEKANTSRATQGAAAFSSDTFDTQRFSENMAKAGDLWNAVIGSMRLPSPDQSHHLSADVSALQTAWTQSVEGIMQDPSSWMDTQFDMAQDYLDFWHHWQKRAMGETNAPYIAPDARDKRFSDSAWGENIFYDAVKESYLMANKWMQQGLNLADVKDAHLKRKLGFFAQQMMDALSPSNYLLTNPQAMKELIESNGDNLVQGLTHLLEDVERGDGQLRIRMTDESAFEVGENLATTKGSVVFENDLMQLIQYAPTTEQVHATPLLIMPAWINKFYIFDLQEKNSFVKWAVDQGYTVFMISWVNPNETHSQKGFDDYLKEGPLAALDAIEKATGTKETNIIGYCLGGTLLSITLAYLKAKGKASRVKSATFLTTLVDYSDVGDLSVFIDEETIAAIEERMSACGYMPAEDMQQTFNMLRANDLIWSFYINNYLLGKTPFPFDILYWNSDSTRLPAEMNRFYLRNFYQKNLLAQAGSVTIDGVEIDLSTVETPAYLLSTQDDHIAPWQSTYATAQLFSGPVTFTLAESGHVAGVISPASKEKYGYYASNALPEQPQDWLKKASYTKRSWWLHWDEWMQKEGHQGEDVAASTRKPGGKKLKPIEPAPGRYVKA